MTERMTYNTRRRRRNLLGLVGALLIALAVGLLVGFLIGRIGDQGEATPTEVRTVTVEKTVGTTVEKTAEVTVPKRPRPPDWRTATATATATASATASATAPAP